MPCLIIQKGQCSTAAPVAIPQPFHDLSVASCNCILHAAAGVGFQAFNNRSKKTLAHPEYHLIQCWWHPTKNLGKLPGDFTHASNQYIWLSCPGCIHECGRHHEWKAKVSDLTGHWRSVGHIVCPSCDSKGDSFCECRSVANEPRLSREWHPDNPPAREVAKSSNKKFLWVCLKGKGHPVYKAACNKRCCDNTGCPVCGRELSRTTRHPVVSIGRPDLVEEWEPKMNTKEPSEVTLGSHYRAWWVCSRNPEHLPWQAKVQNRALRGTGCPACRELNRYMPRFFGAGHN